MPSLAITNKCNNNCLMCTNPDDFLKMRKGFLLPDLIKKIMHFNNDGGGFLENFRDTFYISGGEPSLSPHLFTLLGEINDIFPRSKISCLTNARRFAYKKFAQNVLKNNPGLELAVAIHGPDANIHDRITRTPGSFLETIDGLKNISLLKKPQQILEIRIIIHSLNYRYIEETTSLIKEKFPLIDRLVYLFFEIEGQAVKNLKLLKLTYSQLKPYLENIHPALLDFSEVRFYHFPLCTVPARLFPLIWRTLPEYEVSFPASCKSCRLETFCQGVHKGYLKYFGSSEFHPIYSDLNVKKSGNQHCPIAR